VTRVAIFQIAGGAGKRQLVAALVSASVLAGCASDALFKRPVAPPPPLQIEAGSRLTLGAPLRLPPGTAALYFQDNQLVSAGGIARDYPYCKLAPASGTAPGVVDATTFAVQSVDYDDKERGSTGNAMNTTRILLVANPTQAYTLSCRWPEGGPSREFLTSEEIQGAIGSHFAMALER
jgi:hypothetical protein